VAADTSVGNDEGQLEAMAEWLAGLGVTHVESTGVYGKPIDNILEGRFTI
jgi:hypothetical protein